MGGGTGARAGGESGAPGSSVSTARGGRLAVRGPREERDPRLARAAALAAATQFRPIGIAAAPGPADTSAPTSIWGREVSVGADATTVRASLWGDGRSDAFASGGLTLGGTGEGGGGRAELLGLGDFGALGLAAGVGTNAAFGPGDGMGGAGEGAGGLGHGIGMSGGRGMGGGGGSLAGSSRRVRCGYCDGDGTLSINGRLPPETIQRIVRQSFGRFRYCYQNALAHNPTLEARVVTKFVIARDGSVAMAAAEGPQPLAACVQAAFLALSFPEPAGGTVMVEYPLLLAPDP